MIQKYIEDIQSVFTSLGQVQILHQLDLSQKELNAEAKYLANIGQLSSPSSNTGWSLPNDFLGLLDLWFYDTNGHPLYPGDFNYAYEIVDDKFYIYSLTSTPITGLDASIITAYIFYEAKSGSISSTSDSFDLPDEFHEGILSRAYQKFYMKYPTTTIVNGQVVQAVNPSMAAMFERDYIQYRRKLKIARGKDGTVKQAKFYPYAGKFELPRRVKDVSSSTILAPITSLYERYALWTLDFDAGTVTERIVPVGFDGTVTASLAGYVLTITSTESGDFPNTIDHETNWDDYNQTSFTSTQWVFTFGSNPQITRFEIHD